MSASTFAPPGYTRLVNVALLALSLVGCTKTDFVDAHQDDAADAAGDAASAAWCGDTPRVLVADLLDVVHAEGAVIQVPTVRVNGDGLFFALSWDAPLGSPVGPGGYVMRVSAPGDGPVQLATIQGGGADTGQGLAVSGSTVIWSQIQGSAPGEGAILSVAATGGETTLLASTSGLANALVADHDTVYFVDTQGTKSVPLAGGAVRTLTQQTAFSLAVDGATLYLAGGGAISSVSVQGGPVTVLVSDPEGQYRVLPCGPNVCWTSGPALDSSVKQVTPAGAATVLARDFVEPHDIVFTGNSFFVSASPGGGALYRIPAAGGAPVLIHLDPGLAGLALDDTCLYWSGFREISSWSSRAAEAAPATEGS